MHLSTDPKAEDHCIYLRPTLVAGWQDPAVAASCYPGGLERGSEAPSRPFHPCVNSTLDSRGGGQRWRAGMVKPPVGQRGQHQACRLDSVGLFPKTPKRTRNGDRQDWTSRSPVRSPRKQTKTFQIVMAMRTLQEVRAGRMLLEGKMLKADPRKGCIRIAIDENDLVHFQWAERAPAASAAAELDIVVFPDESVFDKARERDEACMHHPRCIASLAGHPRSQPLPRADRPPGLSRLCAALPGGAGAQPALLGAGTRRGARCGTRAEPARCAERRRSR